MNDSLLVKAFDDLWSASADRNWLYGRLGRKLEGGGYEVDVVGNPKRVYVTMGSDGDQGETIAIDLAGVAKVAWTAVKMRREHGDLVIREAGAYAAGSGNGGGGGATSFFQLEDVNPLGWDSGDAPVWNAAAGRFDPVPMSAGGEGGMLYYPGDGIEILANLISAKPNVNRGIIIDSTGIGVKADTEGGLAAHLNGDGLYIYRKTNSGLNITDEGISVGEGMGINVIGDIINVDVTDLHDPLKGLTETGNQLQIQLGVGVANGGTDPGLLFTAAGALVIGKGDGIDVNFDNVAVKANELVGQGLTTDGSNNFKVLFSDTPLAGMGYGSNDGIYIGEGDGIRVLANSIEVKLSTLVPDGMAFDVNGGIYIGDGDGINVSEGGVAVDVVELISPFVYGMEHDGQNNFAVALEANSGIRFNGSSGRLELGEPGDLTVHSQSILIDDTHYHQVATSSDPGPNEQIMATDIYGGFIFDTNLMVVDAANDRVGINTVPENLVGAAALDVLVDNLDDITQRLRQKENQRGRIWRVENYEGKELIVLDSVGNLQSGNPGFVSGLTGWQITHHGNAEFNNIWARGELHATVFVKDEIHATGGTFMVATAATFFEDVVVSGAGGGEGEFLVDINPTGALGFGPLEIVTTSPTFEGNTLNIFSAGNFIKLNHPPSGPATYFQPGEILRVKTEIENHDNPIYDNEGKIVRLADVWLVVNQGDASNEEYGLYSVTKMSGSDCVIPKGTAIVTYGRPGDGAILMTSDWRDEGDVEAGTEHTPYIDIFTTGEEPWSGLAGAIIPHVRLGQLSGVGIPGISGISRFGLLAGSNLADANSSYLAASGEGIDLYRGVIRMHNGANLTGEWDQNGNFKLGKNVGQKVTRSFEVVTAAGDPEEGDVWIGDRASSNYLHWDASTGTLLVTGALQVGGGEGFAQVSYVDQAEEDAVRRAGEYTDAEIASIGDVNNDYADSHRMVAVDGSWTSPAYNKVSWTSAKAYFANQTSRTITNSAAGGITVPVGRTFLYVDLAQVGNLTIVAVQSAASLIQPTYVVIAVVDVGTSAAASARAAINIVVGSTYISGANIFTGSILASNIAALAIDTGWLAAEAVTAAKIDANLLSTMNGRNVRFVEGILIPTARVVGQAATNIVSWGGVGNNLRVHLNNDVVVTVTAGSRPITGLEYAYIINRTANATVAMLWYDPLEAAIDNLPADAIIICVCESGPEAASAVMVKGGVIISGDNIVAGSITAGQIKARSITAGLIASNTITETEMDDDFVQNIADDAAAAAIAGTATAIDEDTIVGMTGKISADGTVPTPVVGRFSWPAMTVRYKTGRTSSITTTGSPYNMVGTASTTRAYFCIDPDLASTALKIYENIASILAGEVIIAVGERQTIASSVTMVYGGVVISGNSIVAGSITSTQIQAESITADKVETDFFFTNSSRVVSISPKLVASDTTRGLISWNQITLCLGSGDRTITAGSYNMGSNGKIYFYVNPALTGNLALTPTSNVSLVPVTCILIAVAELGTQRSSVTMLHGGVMISGDSIVAGSITAELINVGTLEALKATTGDLTVDGKLSMGANGYIEVSTGGFLRSVGKGTSPLSTTPGFFLGWDGVAPAGYKFLIGQRFDQLTWMPYDPDIFGTGLSIETNNPIRLTSEGTDPSGADPKDDVFRFYKNNGNVGNVNITLSHQKWGIQVNGDWKFLGNMHVENQLLVNDRIYAQRIDIAMPANGYGGSNIAMLFTEGAGSGQLKFGASAQLPSRLDWTEDMYIAKSLQIGSNLVVGGKVLRLGLTEDNPWGTPPTNSNAPGTKGDISITDNGIYVCVANNYWKRADLNDL